jgi:hypothetical protein
LQAEAEMVLFMPSQPSLTTPIHLLLIHSIISW